MSVSPNPPREPKPSDPPDRKTEPDWPRPNDGRRTPTSTLREMLARRFERVKGILAPGVSLWCGCGYARNIVANSASVEMSTSGVLVCSRCDRA